CAVLSFAFLIFAIYATYPLQLFVVTDILLEWLAPLTRSRSHAVQQAASVALRVSLVLTTGVVAVAIPDFGLLMGLIGALGASSLQFTFPALIYLATFWRATRWPFRLLLMFYVLFGVVGCIVG